jgi:aryl-alcohol dehydrogenase (NADP+)
VLGATGWDVFPLCLGGNVFGWTADEQASFAVLDSYTDAGGNFIDTADQYAAFAPGHSGGESETVIGRWFASRGSRARMLLATKVGRKPGLMGLAPATIRQAVAESLARLQTDYIDLLYAHADDPETPLEETLGTFGELVQAGRVRHIAASNYTAPRLAEALATSANEGLPKYVALQAQYSLVERNEFEGELQAVCVSEDLPCVPYWGLARGFLTGKYRPRGDAIDSPRARAASAYLDARGVRILDALDAIAADLRAPVAAVALAWLAAQPGVGVPLASARTPEQLAELLAGAQLRLGAPEIDVLDRASRR